MRFAMLDALPTWARDLTLTLVAALLGWAGSDLVPILRDQGGVAAVVAPVLLVTINAITPQLTHAYGLGRRQEDAATEAADAAGSPPPS